MQKALTEVILVKYNNISLEVDALRAIVTHANVPYHLTCHDNYIKKQNLGLLWNKLIKKSDADFICLINSDTIVEPQWLSKLLDTFELIDNVGVVGPSTDNCHNQQKEKRQETFIDFTKEYPGWVLSGFCLVFPKKVWKEVGGFPEDFSFYGQEVVFIDKIVNKGYKQIWRTDVFVHHEGEASIKKAEANGEINIKEEREKSRQLIEKWRNQ